MKTHNLGYPRIGSKRELKKACEQYWQKKISLETLIQTGKEIKLQNWILQKEAGIDLIPSNDFSFYDQVLDTSLMVGAIPERYQKLLDKNMIDLYFAMARGYQDKEIDVIAMEMTKWFDTNYHYIVPEFHKNQTFRLFSTKVLDEFIEAKQHGIYTKPVLVGPISYLMLGKEKEPGFHRIELIRNLLPVYIEIIKKLEQHEAEWIQLDEPFLALDINPDIKEAYQWAYQVITEACPDINILLATYFEGLHENLPLALSLPVKALHIDLVRCPQQLNDVIEKIPYNKILSLGMVDGRNVWKNNFSQSLEIIHKVLKKIPKERIMLAPSCSLLHVPCDLDLEEKMNAEIKQWLSFAKQKLEELVTLKQLITNPDDPLVLEKLKLNEQAIEKRKQSHLIHNENVKERLSSLTDNDFSRKYNYSFRKEQQQKFLKLPLFPTTTIGSFPQTTEVRNWRARYKKGEIANEQYETFIKEEIRKTIRLQEEIGLDVLVHGEFERNDMVEYFGEQLEGFVFTSNGWVQSYGSRCVKPTIIYGDVWRREPMTVKWITFAQSLTQKPVKGMLTGPVTILQWSFVRDDQPRWQTCFQIALAIRDEVLDLEKAGIKIIQIDEPAIREGLPLRKKDWQNYLQWAVKAFRLTSSGVKEVTQIHTHMCYSEFNDIIDSIAAMDADVITIETSRSQMELLKAFSHFKYPNDIGPGIYDIHSPRIPSIEEMQKLIEKAIELIPIENIWINPDCGLKTRGWEETLASLKNMVKVAQASRERYKIGV